MAKMFKLFSSAQIKISIATLLDHYVLLMNKRMKKLCNKILKAMNVCRPARKWRFFLLGLHINIIHFIFKYLFCFQGHLNFNNIRKIFAGI